MTHVIDPTLAQWATAKQKAYIAAANRLGSVRAVERELGLRNDAAGKSLRALKDRAALQGYHPASDMTHVAPSPFVVKGTSTLYDADGNVSQQWVKTKLSDVRAEEAIRAFIAHLVDDVRGLSPAIPAPKVAMEDLLTVYPMGDPHFGLYAWAEEAGADFDLAMAERLTNAAIDRLVECAPASKTAILLNLGDMFHADNESNRTTQSGNSLDVDTRWGKVMQVGLRSMIHCIRRLAEKHERVIVRINRGNHDDHSAYALALALDAFFSNNDRIQVDLSTAKFWYFEFGKVLLGSTHGDTCKMNNLAGVMAADEAPAWGRTTQRYFYVGHVHHDEVKEYPGMKAESFRTLAARDAWHAGQGYRAGRDMRCIVHHIEHGELERHRADIGMLQ